jgi:hypothetical protein
MEVIMRITTQMLNESAMKAGYSGLTTSLLDYINDSSTSTSTGNALLDALNAKNASTYSSTSYSYKKIQLSAEGITDNLSNLMEDGADSVFDKAEKSGNTADVVTYVKALADDINSTLKNLTTSTSSLDSFYRSTLKELGTDNAELLGGIGITVSKNGTLSVDSDKLSACSVDDIKNVFGSDSSFANKLNYVATHIADNASANAESSSSQYTSSGSLSSALSGKYDLWG